MLIKGFMACNNQFKNNILMILMINQYQNRNYVLFFSTNFYLISSFASFSTGFSFVNILFLLNKLFYEDQYLRKKILLENRVKKDSDWAFEEKKSEKQRRKSRFENSSFIIYKIKNMGKEVKQKFCLYDTLSKIQGISWLRQPKIRQLIQKQSVQSLIFSKEAILNKAKQLFRAIKTNKSLLEDHELMSTIITIRNRYGKIQNCSRYISYIVKKIAQQSSQLFKQHEKMFLKSSSIHSEPSIQIKNKTKSQHLAKKHENQLHETIQNILTNKIVVNDPNCFGCIKMLSHSSMDLPFDSAIILNLKQFFNQQFLTDTLCGILNSRSSCIFITLSHSQSEPFFYQGFTLTYAEKIEYETYINKCLQYIEPRANIGSEIQIQYIPIAKRQQNGQEKKKIVEENYVIKISAKENKYKIMSYVSYKLNGDKKIDYKFFMIKNRTVHPIESSELYNIIHANYKISLKSQQQKNVHKNIKCTASFSLKFSQNSSLKFNDTNLGDRDTKIEVQKANQLCMKINKNQVKDNKFKFSVLVLSVKIGDSIKGQKIMAEIQKQLGKQKILCHIQRILDSIQGYNFWIISYDCSGSLVESIIKMGNKTGEFSIFRPKKTIKIIDEDFFNQNKDKFLISKLKQQGGTLKQMYNCDDKTINASQKKNPIILKFKHLKDSIYSFGLLQSLCRRIQFIKIQ